MHEKLIILDFGSQTTQLIGRRVRELNMYCEIVPYNKFPHDATDVKGVILSGSPYSVYDANAFKVRYVVNIPYWESVTEPNSWLIHPVEMSNRPTPANTDVPTCCMSQVRTNCWKASMSAHKSGCPTEIPSRSSLKISK